MFALSFGVERISNILPIPICASLSGLNASTPGIIAVAAVQRAEKCTEDILSKLLIIFDVRAGVLHNALWYYPNLVVTGGLVTIIWVLLAGRYVSGFKQQYIERGKRAVDKAAHAENVANPAQDVPLQTLPIINVAQPRRPGIKNDSLVQRRERLMIASASKTTKAYISSSS